MRKTNCRIGFDDRLVTLIMVPVVSLIIPMIFFGRRFGREPEFTWKVYVSTLIITTTLWLGNRYIMILMRRRYPEFEQTRRRLWVQSSMMLLFTVIATNILDYFLKDFCGFMDTRYVVGGTKMDIIINANSSALLCTLTVVAIYESVYFMNALRHSVEEKELLKRESLKAQLDALKTQVNPHFLFNNLNTLSSVIPENPQQAIDFVQQLSKVYRHILEVRDEKNITLREELEVLKAYAFLLKTRFGDNIDINIQVAEEKLQKKVVPLSLQILMENAIKHNIVSSEKPLRIDVFAVNGKLVVSNNLQKKNQLPESTGIGLNNIRNRYKLLGNKTIEVQEDAGNFTVSIPLIEN